MNFSRSGGGAHRDDTTHAKYTLLTNNVDVRLNVDNAEDDDDYDDDFDDYHVLPPQHYR